MTTRTSRRIAAFAAVPLVFLAACSGQGPGTAAGTDLTIALAVEPVSLDPCDTQDATNAVVLRTNVTESLTRIDPETGEVVPFLAESWEQVDPSTWRFTLRQGVRFHDGTPFDAAAAAASINRVLDPELNCQNLDQFPYPLTATALDAATLQVVSESPDSILPLRISYADIGAPATPAGEKTSSPVGTGPYRFAERVQGQSVTLTRNDDYWGQAGQATSVRYVYREEPSVRAGMARTGEASIAVPVSVQDATDDDRTREYQDNRVFFLRTSTEKAPFTDPRVRRAAQQAIDKQTIVGSLMERTGTPFDQIVASTVNGHIDGFTGPAFDPAAAEQLLRAAEADGVDVRAPIDLVTRPDLFPGSDEVIQAIHQNLQSVGFTVNILSLDTDAWLQLLRSPFPPDQKATIIAISHDNISGDASFSFPKYMAGDGSNSTIRNPEIDALLAEAEQAGGAERAALYQRAAEIEYRDVNAFLPIALQSKLLMLGPGIEYQPNSLTGVELSVADIAITTG
ncbi:ABC transporter substrate-binding protein [Pseudonocardia zijingensis]|uniref:ABC transporter substrate-binding protein n=1 Tax=Pseudonocardia zijingensis TaxID=153376 RepID=A0ABN1PJ69_9PSEU